MFDYDMISANFGDRKESAVSGPEAALQRDRIENFAHADGGAADEGTRGADDAVIEETGTMSTFSFEERDKQPQAAWF